MIDEYKFIMKNDVSEIVLISQGKEMMTSKWIDRIKHAVLINIRYNP